MSEKEQQNKADENAWSKFWDAVGNRFEHAWDKGKSGTAITRTSVRFILLAAAGRISCAALTANGNPESDSYKKAVAMTLESATAAQPRISTVVGFIGKGAGGLVKAGCFFYNMATMPRLKAS